MTKKWKNRLSIGCSVIIGWLALGTMMPSADAAWPPIIPGKTDASSASSVASVLIPSFSSGSLTLPIITYHYLEVVQNKKDKQRISMAITPAIFEKTLKELSEKKFQTVFVRDIPGILRRTTIANSPLIALTFDDGYEDFFTDAFPLLLKYSAKATVFVISSYIDKPGYLSREQLQVLNDSGLVEIGAHTVHHKNLTNLSLKNADEEIAGSKQEIEQRLGMHVDTFAYPFGKWNPALASLVSNAGFSAAVTTERGFLQNADKMMSLRRITAGAFMGARKWKTIGETWSK